LGSSDYAKIGIVRLLNHTLFNGSLGFAVMNRQFWRQFDLLGKSCRSPAVQLLA
jgi:hypothetical protein